MNFKKILQIILLCSIWPCYLKPQNTPQSKKVQRYRKASREKQLKEMMKRHGATLCTDTALIQKFNTMQTKLGITPQIPLFTIPNPPSRLDKLTIAFYCPDLQTVTIVQRNFYTRSTVAQDHTLYHELRHHLQHTDQKAHNAVLNYVALKRLSYKQAAEYDADNFGTHNAINNCPVCLHELKQYFSYYQPIPYCGYFTQQDLWPILLKVNQKPNYCCSKHQKLSKNQQEPSKAFSEEYVNKLREIPFLMLITENILLIKKQLASIKASISI